MKRIAHTPRTNLNDIAERYGFGFTVVDGKTYWDESAYYEFTLEQIERDIEDPTEELHGMLMRAMEFVLGSDALMTKFGIPKAAWNYVRNSWNKRDLNVYGRLDLCYNGTGPAKLYEANYDTPTALFEASVFQWDWLESQFPLDDQFNSIHERLINAWTEVKRNTGLTNVHFASVHDSIEDSFTVQYLMDTAIQAGLGGKMIDIADIGIGTLNGKSVFTDLEDYPIKGLFKLYPWEHMLREEFAKHLDKTTTTFVEPSWKCVISNKAMMALLWEMFPNHPNLIEAHFLDDVSGIPDGFVKKPFFSREGAGIIIPGVDETEVEEEVGGYIVQKYTPLTKFGDSYPVIGSWVIGAGHAAGIGIREDATLITKNTSRFVPHLIRG